MRLISRIVKKISPPAKEELSAFLLQDLLHGKPYLPYTSSALYFRSMLCMVNDLLINKRTSVLEFGCGISTVIMARAIRQHKIDARITSVEENADWIGVIKGYLEHEDLSSLVTFVHAPLEAYSGIEKAFSYSPAMVEKSLAHSTFDLVLIDGPSAWQKNAIHSRVSTLDLFKDRLSDRYTIFLDNADRPGEKILASNITTTTNAKKLQVSETFHVFVKGRHFNFIL